MLEVLNNMKVRWISFAIAASLWIVDAYSTGFIEYYPMSLRSTLQNHLFFIYMHWLGNLNVTMTLIGIYWFPTYHIGISLPFYPVFATLFLAYAIFLTVKDTLLSINQGRFKRKAAGKLSFAVFVSTITTGACCTFPIIYYAIAIFFSASASLGFDIYLSYYSYLIDTFIAVFLLLLHRKNTKKRTVWVRPSVTHM